MGQCHGKDTIYSRLWNQKQYGGVTGTNKPIKAIDKSINNNILIVLNYDWSV